MPNPLHRAGFHKPNDIVADMRRFYDDASARIEYVSSGLASQGPDPFGMNLEQLRKTAITAAFFYRYYFRCEITGTENIPEGPVLLVANHAGQIPVDAVMITLALLLETTPPRLCRSLVDRWVHRLPFISKWYARVGIAIGTPENAKRLLQLGAAILTFPEGMAGVQKNIFEAYRLKPFGSGFVRLAMSQNIPIVPVSVVGSEEQYPTLAHWRHGMHLWEMPPFPLWAHMGIPLLGILPLPVKYRIHFAEARCFAGDPDDDDEVMNRRADDTKRCIQQGIASLLQQRKNAFF